MTDQVNYDVAVGMRGSGIVLGGLIAILAAAGCGGGDDDVKGPRLATAGVETLLKQKLSGPEDALLDVKDPSGGSPLTISHERALLVTIDSVSCPADVEQEEGGKFRCRAEGQAKRTLEADLNKGTTYKTHGPVNLTQKDGAGARLGYSAELLAEFQGLVFRRGEIRLKK